MNELQSERTDCHIRGNDLIIRENGFSIRGRFFWKIHMSIQGFRRLLLRLLQHILKILRTFKKSAITKARIKNYFNGRARNFHTKNQTKKTTTKRKNKTISCLMFKHKKTNKKRLTLKYISYNYFSLLDNNQHSTNQQQSSDAGGFILIYLVSCFM